jgi:hypothetical protein
MERAKLKVSSAAKDSCRFPPESYDQEQAKDELRDGHSPSQGRQDLYFG